MISICRLRLAAAEGFASGDFCREEGTGLRRVEDI
jgi:hypothetical protein